VTSTACSTDSTARSGSVYCKRPFGDADQVIRYLGQYTHRVAISNHRLLAMDERNVSFRTKKGERVTLDGVTFLDRWLDHLLPRGFTKIRHYGLLSSSHATTRLDTARQLLTERAEAEPPSCPERPGADLHELSWRDLIRVLTGVETDRCPRCGSSNRARWALQKSPYPARAPP